jgi:hypothetical protein
MSILLELWHRHLTSKIRYALGLAVLGLCAAPGVAAANLPSPASKLIVPGKSIGGVSLGESYTQAQKAWGITKNCNPMTGCTYDGGKNGTASFSTPHRPGSPAIVSAVYIEVHFFRIGKPDWARTPLDKYKTAKGIHLGSTLSTVKKAYPHGKRSCGTVTCSWIVAGPHKASTGFALYKGPKGTEVASILVEEPAS